MKATKINLSEKVFISIIVTIVKDKAMDRLCLNAQSSIITATWPKPCFYYFFDGKILVVCSGNIEC